MFARSNISIHNKFINMDPLSAFLFSLLCSAAYDGIKASLKSRFPEHITDRISKAFDNALVKWTPNKQLRENKKKTLTEKIYLLKEQIVQSTNPEDIDEETQNLLNLFKIELMSDPIAYHYLEELHWDKTENDLAKLNQATQEILAYFKPQKAQPHIDFPFNHFIKKIASNKYYIPRRIQKASENIELSENSDLISLIEENKTTNIVVLASAGMGKTEELKQTAITLANRESKYPIFISFSNFTADKDIEHYLPNEWINVPQEKLALLFDGFDELIDDEIHIIQRKLSLFVENHPQITIVVSCRTNFYHLSINGNSETLKGFGAYYLQALKYEDVVNYVSIHHGINGSLFMNAVYQKQFEDLVYNPFFLQILIPDFKQNNAFSGNRIQLFQKFIKERLSWDKEHFATSYSLNDEEERALELLRKVSIAMEMLGSRNIIVNDLRTLISEKSDFELIKHCTVFNKEEGSEQWKFEHNNFQEILCAEKLAELPFETVIDLISFKGYNKIQPSWTNTVSFLISLLNENDKLFQPLIDWIISNDPEVLVKVEKERIPLKIRTEIFIQIFNYYKELNIWINSNKFSYSDLARFGESDEIIDFIVKEISIKDNSIRCRLNAIFILGDFVNINLYKIPHTKEVLFDILTNEEHKADFVYNIINCLSDVGSLNKGDIDKLLIHIGSRKSEYIRSATYSLINKNACVDYYVNYYIEGLELLSKDFISIEDSHSSNLAEEGIGLFNGILLMKELASINKVVYYFIEHYYDIEDEFELRENYECLVENAIEIFIKGQTAIFDTMFDLLYCQVKKSNSYFLYQKTIPFFEKTNTLKNVFERSLNKIIIGEGYDFIHFHILRITAEQSGIEYLMKVYKNKQIDEQKIILILQGFFDSNHVLSPLIISTFEGDTSINIERHIQIDYETLRKAKLQNNFNILFDIDAFMTQCVILFEDKNEIHKSQLYDHIINKKSDLNYIMPSPILVFLRKFSNESEIVLKSKVMNWFDNPELFTNYSISRIYEQLFRDKSGLVIQTNQEVYIYKWFSSVIEKIDFCNAIKRSEGNSFTINSQATYCVFFMQKFNFECSENILLDMLSFTFNDSYISQEYILKKVDKQKVEQRIISNIKNKTLQNDTVYMNHVEYIYKNQLIEVYSCIFDDLCNIFFDEYYQRNIIDLYFKYNEDVELLKSFFDKLSFAAQITTLRWIVKKEDLEYSTTKLLDLHKENLDEQSEKDVNNLLISCKSNEGLEYSIQWIKKHMQSSFSQHGQSLVYFENIDSLPYFMELLELSYNKDVKNGNELDGMLSIVLDGIYYLAIQSELNFKEVCRKLKEFIDTNKGKLEEVEFLNATIERIKEKFFQTHSLKFSIKQIKQQLNSLAV